MNMMWSLLVALWPLAGYLFKASGLYSLAESRRIRNPWISWIPVFNAWMLGCISDQYRYVTRGEATRRRTWLLVLPIAKVVSYVLVMGAAIVCLAMDTVGTAALVLLALCLAVSLIQYILELLATYDLHRSCEPETAGIFLVFGILIPGLRPIFIFLNRNKELGMPPRKTVVN